jgi:cytochrome P450
VTTEAPDLPLNDPAFYASDPFDTYRILRDEHPVYWCQAGGFWALTRYEHVLSVSRDPTTFCNGQGMTMRGGELENVKGGETLITCDAPQHTHQRRLINRAFSQRAVAVLEPRVRAIADQLLDQVPLGEPFDFVDRVAAILPVVVIAELLGIPVEDRDKFVEWSNASVGVADPEYAHLQASAVVEQYQYFEHMLDERRTTPCRDLLTVIVGAEADAASDFNHQDAMSLCSLLLAAGNETTRNLISHSVRVLGSRPDQLAQLRESNDAHLAVEELLRFISPVIHMARTVTTETEIGGRKLAIGDQVVLIYGAANRDERQFGASAADLVLDRDPNPHLSFGFGPHFCLGAALARLEARVLLEETVRRFVRWSVVGPVERLHSTMILGIKHLPVILSDR